MSGSFLPFGWNAERGDLFEKAKRPQGTTCDLCQRYIKVYKRKINHNMARWLIGLVNRYVAEPRWISVAEPWSKRIDSRENAKFIHWDMVEEKPKDADETNKRTSGFWKPTAVGVRFVRRQCAVPCYKFLYKNELIFEEGPQITIIDALDDKFDYEELMAEGME